MLVILALALSCNEKLFYIFILLVLIYFPFLFCVLFEFAEKKSDINRLESGNRLLAEELTQAKITNENMTKTLEDAQNQNKVHGETLSISEFDLELSLWKIPFSIINRPCLESWKRQRMNSTLKRKML